MTMHMLRPRSGRLLRYLVVAGVAGLVAAALLIDRSPKPPTTPGNPLPTISNVPLTAADRRGINRALDVFLTSAVERRDVARSYDVVTPALRAGKTRAQWTPDHLPVMPYQAREQRAHDWRLTYSHPGEAGMELLLHPAPGSKLGAIAFTIRMKRLAGRWLVDSWYPNALFAPAGSRANIVAVPDLGPSAVPDHGQTGARAWYWFLIPLGIVMLPMALALGLAALAVVRRLRSSRVTGPADERALASWDAYRPRGRDE
jgi:hypothetical protein